MHHSPYLNLNRDLTFLRKLVRDHQVDRARYRNSVAGKKLADLPLGSATSSLTAYLRAS